jgi:hypothetical protein
MPASGTSPSGRAHPVRVHRGTGRDRGVRGWVRYRDVFLSGEVQVLVIGLLYSIVGLSRHRSGYRPDVPDYHTLHAHTRCRHRYNSEELRRCDCAAVGGRFHWLNWHRGAS